MFSLYFFIYILFFFLLLYWIFVAVCGLFFSCEEPGLLFVAVHGLLIVVASLVVEHRLQAYRLQYLQRTGSVVVAHGPGACRLSSCGAWAQLLWGMWNLPRPGIEPMSPALAGGFLFTVPPGKSYILFSIFCSFLSFLSFLYFPLHMC